LISLLCDLALVMLSSVGAFGTLGMSGFSVSFCNMCEYGIHTIYVCLDLMPAFSLSRDWVGISVIVNVIRNVTSTRSFGDTPIHPDNIGGWVIYPPTYVFWAPNGSGPIYIR